MANRNKPWLRCVCPADHERQRGKGLQSQAGSWVLAGSVCMLSDPCKLSTLSEPQLPLRGQASAQAS
jgi:hypothetical protein